MKNTNPDWAVMTVLACPNCPVCGEPPVMAISVVQAFCHTSDCPAITWNMTISKDENLDTTNFIDLKTPKA
jgi:hypothetical protein